jgi:hypothetical protein
MGCIQLHFFDLVYPDRKTLRECQSLTMVTPRGTDSYTSGVDGDNRSENLFIFSGVYRAMRSLPPEPIFW